MKLHPYWIAELRAEIKSFQATQFEVHSFVLAVTARELNTKTAAN